MSRAASFFFCVEMTRSNRPGFAGEVAGVESGTADCAAALGARHFRTTMREIARFHMVRCGGKAARVHTRWIRWRIHLLYTATERNGAAAANETILCVLLSRSRAWVFQPVSVAVG